MMYNEWEEEELKKEMRIRKFKVGGKKRKKEEMIRLLEEDDRGQKRIVWGRSRKEGDIVSTNTNSGGREIGVKEEEGGEPKPPPVCEGGDPEWEDIIPVEEANGREAGGRPEPKPRLGRTSPLKDTGRLQGGRGKRGYWVRRKEMQIGSKVKRVKGAELGREEDTRADTKRQANPAQT